MSIFCVDCLKVLSTLLVVVIPLGGADKIVKSPQTVRSVNYEDFSLLCADGIPLLMEDHKPRPCQPRPWLPEQKCPTGFWCHEGQSEHSFYCCPSSRKFANRCHLPPAVGYGKQRMRRFYFDWKTDACHELQYSGIGGNENSFMDYERCEQVCRGAGEPPISLPSNMKIMPKEPEPPATSPRPKQPKKPEKAEKKVVYPKEVAAPVSLQPPKPPSPADRQETVHEVFYTIPPSTVPQTTTVTQTTTTIAQTEPEEVLDPNPCVLSPEKGFAGSKAVSMWYYDATSTTCHPFMYLGKGGNSNRFETSEECTETCAIGKPTRKSCDLPPAIGNGPFNIPRYYFDKVTRRCERFFYSGRDGNDNRFYKKNKCERLCLRKKPKKKENIFEFTTTPLSPVPPFFESTPMRIIQNLIPVPTTTTTTSPPESTQHQHTDPYPFATPTSRIVPITVEPWVEVITENQGSTSSSPSDSSLTTTTFEFVTSAPPAHPTLIYEPRGETLPTIVPPVSTTTPSIADHVFSSLMNTQQERLVELVQTPVEMETAATTTTTVETSAVRKFGSHERIPFGQVEQQPVPPMNAYGAAAKPTENQYGMKVEPFQNTEYVLPPHYPHQPSIYLPQPPYSEVKNKSDPLPPPPPPASSPSSVPYVAPTFASQPSPDVSSSAPLTAPGALPAPTSQVNPYVVPGPIPQPSVAQSFGGPTSTQAGGAPVAPMAPSAPVAPMAPNAPNASNAPNAPSAPNAPNAPNAPAPSPFQPDPHQPTHYIVPSHPIPTLSPTVGPPLTYPSPSTTTMLPPLPPTLLPPNPTYAPLPPPDEPTSTNDSPCARRIFGDATIMCENRHEICPMGTFCQIGQGQSICCPIMDEPPCEQAIEEGVGSTLIRRWYFDPATRLCQPFNYKGFKGNQNNFQTFDSCHRACGATNICPGGSPQMSIHTHLLSCNSEADCAYGHLCIQSTPHNLCCPTVAPAPVAPEPPANLVVDFLPSPPVHSSNNLCDQPVDVGYGMLAEHRWAFSSGGQCTSFLYAGHGGNMNNFLTRADCVKTCQTPLAPPTSQCSLPAASGHGEQYLSRYFYSPEYRQCLHFIYSGDGGNANCFETLTECLETCVANGVKFSSLASTPTPTPLPTLSPIIQPTFSTHPRNVCPQGDPLITVHGAPIQCDPSKAAKCPGDHVCTPVGGEAYCCPSPMNFCLQTRPAISVCTGPDFEPIREIRFTYDPMADRCVRFSFQNCRGASFTPPASLNNFVSNSQCNRLCCNQGYNLVYKRRLLMAMADDPLTDD